jgi:hypothetical protein
MRPEKSASTKSGNPRPRLRVKKITNPSHGLPRLATQVRSPSTKGPMHGAATTPSVSPMKKLPKSPVNDRDAIRARLPGRRISQTPKRLVANPASTEATTTSTTVLWSAAPMRPPVRAATTPRDELARARPST